MTERSHPPDRVDAPEEPAHPLALVRVAELRPVAALAAVHRVAEATEFEQRAAGVNLGRHHRNLGALEFERELVFLEDLRRAPAARAVELDHHRRPIVAAHLGKRGFRNC